VLTYDYVGALIASLAFPLLLVPHLGMIRTAWCLALPMWRWPSRCCWCCAGNAGRGGSVAGALVAASLIAGLFYAERIQRFSEIAYYGEG
jgi:spermidine synthase